jgi:hypothetical protein
MIESQLSVELPVYKSKFTYFMRLEYAKEKRRAQKETGL